MVTLAGIVIARQRPQTAKGYVFILIEDEYGHINVIVKPKIYDRCRAAVRIEPFLLVRGNLRKDGATLNIMAQDIRALQYRPECGQSPSPSETPSEDTSSFAYLNSLRKHPPGTKNFG